MGLNYKKLIRSIVDHKLEESEMPDFRWRAIHGIIRKSKYLKKHGVAGLAEFLIYMQKKSNFLEHTLTINKTEHYYVSGLIKIFERNRQWKRDYQKWKPVSYNKNKQFRALVLHLFGTYQVPKFMDTVWFRRDNGSYKYREWYIRLSKGESLRKQKFKIPITKKMAHFFGMAPEDYKVEQAVTWAVVLSEGGDKRLVNEFILANPSNFYEDLTFWKSFIKFLVSNPMIDKHQIGPIIDFINYQKFNNSDAFGGGEVITLPPPQPNFSMNNRNPKTLLNLVDGWHGNIKKIGIRQLLKFDISSIGDYSKTTSDDTSIQIKQLTSNFALYDEGEQLRHCVGSYAYSCFAGNCTIWSFSKIKDGKLKKLLTIALNREGVISEIRGACNRFPTKVELNHIQRWAILEKLVISEWVITSIQ